jgi:hypothetical protein
MLFFHVDEEAGASAEPAIKALDISYYFLLLLLTN